MDKDIFIVLDYVSQFIYGSIVDIAPLVNKILPLTNGASKDIFESEKSKVNRFLNLFDEEKYLQFNTGTRSNIGQYETEEWFSGYKLEVLMAPMGIVFLNQERLNRSVLGTNRSISRNIVTQIILGVTNVLPIVRTKMLGFN